MSERIDLDEDGVDDVAISDVAMFRLERMDRSAFWVAAYLADGNRHVFWLRSSRNGKLTVAHTKEAQE